MSFIKTPTRTLTKVFTNWWGSFCRLIWSCCCWTTKGEKKLLLIWECYCALKNRCSKLACFLFFFKNPFSPERRLWHSWSSNLDVKSCEPGWYYLGHALLIHLPPLPEKLSVAGGSLVSSSGPDFRTRLVVTVLFPRITRPQTADQPDFHD